MAKDTAHGQSHMRQVDLIGYHEALTFEGSRLRDNVARIVHQSPAIGNQILNGFGYNMGNTSLSYREWALITISVLTAIGDCTDQLDVYVKGALKHGIEVEEILDIYHHAQDYVGNPRAVNALRATWTTLSSAQETSLPQDYTESLVRLGDHDTLVQDTHGEGVPIVLIHALSLDCRMWKFILPTLAASTGARVIVYDMRGHGYARGAALTKNLEHLCADLETLLDTLGIEKADIYGCSFGGSVAQTFALDYPNRVRSIAAIATGAKALPVLLERADKAERDGMPAQLPETIMRWFHPETIAVSPWCVRYARRCVERARVEEWAAAWRAMGRLNALPRMAEMKVPVLSLSGSHDVSSTPAMMKELAAACINSDAEFVSIENGTHMMVIEQPEPTAEALIAFRRKIDSKL